MSGDQTLFTNAEGIERLWEVSHPLLDARPRSSSTGSARGDRRASLISSVPAAGGCPSSAAGASTGESARQVSGVARSPMTSHWSESGPDRPRHRVRPAGRRPAHRRAAAPRGSPVVVVDDDPDLRLARIVEGWGVVHIHRSAHLGDGLAEAGLDRAAGRHLRRDQRAGHPRDRHAGARGPTRRPPGRPAGQPVGGPGPRDG